MARDVLFIDNGGHSIKALYLPATPTQKPHDASHSSNADDDRDNDDGGMSSARVFVMPNCVGAAPHAGTGIMGDQLAQLAHFNGVMVRRPVDRGFLVDGGLQVRIWEHVLQHFAITQESQVDLWLTVPFACPKAVAQVLMLVCTRSFHFHSVTFVSSTFLALVAASYHTAAATSTLTAKGEEPGPASPSSPARRKRTHDERAAHDREMPSAAASPRLETANSFSLSSGTGVVVDVGFSGTSIVPYIDFLPVLSSAVRLDVGGKLLTNRLKEFLSFRQVNVMEDTWMINHVKERCCAVSRRPLASLRHYAALWKEGQRSVEEMEAAHDAETRAGPPAHRNEARRREDKKRRRVEVGEDDKTNHGDDGAAELETPVRYYLPTIPALLPLGVTERELPTRLPSSSAVDASALQHLFLSHERFLIPELLFTPGDVGLDQQGLTQAITHGIFQRGLLQHVVTLLRSRLLSRVCVFGGTAALPQLCARLQAEVAASSLSPGPSSSPTCTAVCSCNDSEMPEDGDAGGTAAAGAADSACVLKPAPLPAAMRGAAAATSTPVTAMQPLLGAYRLLRADSREHPQLAALRALVQRRSRVDLLQPGIGRVTVETMQEALRRVV